jgi:hypothetical protein
MSEWLYGVRSVTAALQAARRPLHTLYLSQSHTHHRNEHMKLLLKRVGVRMEMVAADRLEQLSRQSKHQGMVLKCGELKVGSVMALPAAMGDATHERTRHGINSKVDNVKDITHARLDSLNASDVRGALQSWLQVSIVDSSAYFEIRMRSNHVYYRAMLTTMMLLIHRQWILRCQFNRHPRNWCWPYIAFTIRRI